MNYIFSTIYPGSKKFFNEFIDSVNNQTCKNFKIFLVLNGTDLNSAEKKKIVNEYKTFKIDTTWQKARIKGLKKLLKLKPKNIIFADSDDILQKDRIKFSLNEIRNYDFAVNNCYLFKKKKSKNKIWLRKKREVIKFNQIKYKNFVGCSNTIVRAKSIKKIIDMINVDLTAFDWCMATLLLIKKFKGIYTSKPLTYYRQYQQNTSSLIKISRKKIAKDIKCKIEHFRYFEKFGIDYKKNILDLENKYKKIDDKKLFSRIKKKFKLKNQYWWSAI